jgi:hypothetical protein
MASSSHQLVDQCSVTRTSCVFNLQLERISRLERLPRKLIGLQAACVRPNGAPM